MGFPLRSVPTLSYRTGPRRFGAPRDGGVRLHAGCDLIAPQGTEVLAVEDGVVTLGPYAFYRGTYAIEVRHANFVARYCEISDTAEDVAVGTPVKKGDVIAFVGRMRVSSMLHFEMYSGTGTGPLTQRDRSPYQRRSDLIDPTPYLDQWAAEMAG